MNIQQFANKKILLIGMGIEGKATLNYLRHYYPDAVIDIADKVNGENYLANQDRYDIAVRSPSVRRDLVRIPYTTATNMFFANTKGTVVGITGTKGKSTTTTLIYEILKNAGLRAHLVGNIGNPALTELLQEKDKDDIYVYELSSYQLEDIEYSPHIAVFVSFFPEHMDHHGSVEAYWQAKKRIASFLMNEDYLVYNPSFERLRILASETPAHALAYTDKLPCRDEEIPLKGKHNRDNVRAAVTVGNLFRVPPAIMRESIMAFRPLPHRLEHVGTYKEILFYDDGISTTPESTISAIEALDGVQTIFLGGQDRGYVFDELVRMIDRSSIENVVLFPDSGVRIGEILAKYAKRKFRIITTRDMKEAVAFAYQHTKPGRICLLSTASPSYSIWKNFEEKGELFQKYIRELGSTAA